MKNVLWCTLLILASFSIDAQTNSGPKNSNLQTKSGLGSLSKNSGKVPLFSSSSVSFNLLHLGIAKLTLGYQNFGFNNKYLYEGIVSIPLFFPTSYIEPLGRPLSTSLISHDNLKVLSSTNPVDVSFGIFRRTIDIGSTGFFFGVSQRFSGGSIKYQYYGGTNQGWQDASTNYFATSLCITSGSRFMLSKRTGADLRLGAGPALTTYSGKPVVNGVKLSGIDLDVRFNGSFFYLLN